MRVLVPDPGTDATDFVSIYEHISKGGIRADEWDFGVVAAFTPVSSYADARYHIDAMDLIIAAGMEEPVASKHMTIVYRGARFHAETAVTWKLSFRLPPWSTLSYRGASLKSIA